MEWRGRSKDKATMRNFEQIGELHYVGNGSPEGAVRAIISAHYHRLDGGAATSLYVKESNSGGATGWVAK